MLVLARKRGETVCIGDAVRIVVTEILDLHGDKVPGGKVRLGITAPPDVVVDREEVYESKRSQTHGEEEEYDPGDFTGPEYQPF